jgi:hypothetical protein
MSERFNSKAQSKLGKAILSLALGWREESGAPTDMKSSDDPMLDPVIAAITERPGDGFEWRPA